MGFLSAFLFMLAVAVVFVALLVFTGWRGSKTPTNTSTMVALFIVWISGLAGAAWIIHVLTVGVRVLFHV